MCAIKSGEVPGPFGEKRNLCTIHDMTSMAWQARLHEIYDIYDTWHACPGRAYATSKTDIVCHTNT